LKTQTRLKTSDCQIEKHDAFYSQMIVNADCLILYGNAGLIETPDFNNLEVCLNRLLLFMCSQYNINKRAAYIINTLHTSFHTVLVSV